MTNLRSVVAISCLYGISSHEIPIGGKLKTDLIVAGDDIITKYSENQNVLLRGNSNQKATSDSTSSSYIFLQKFPLQGTNNLLFHTEVLVCDHDTFTSDEQAYLDEKISTLTDYVEIDEEWWSSKSKAVCTEFGYGGAACTSRCCAVPHGDKQVHFPLNEHEAVIGNADTTQKSLFLYGISSSTKGGVPNGDVAYHHLCDHKCWSNWAGTDYNPLTNNCNTFTSTVLKCIFGLSEKKPHLGPSDMITVTCDRCPSSTDKALAAME